MVRSGRKPVRAGSAPVRTARAMRALVMGDPHGFWVLGPARGGPTRATLNRLGSELRDCLAVGIEAGSQLSRFGRGDRDEPLPGHGGEQDSSDHGLVHPVQAARLRRPRPGIAQRAPRQPRPRTRALGPFKKTTKGMTPPGRRGGTPRPKTTHPESSDRPSPTPIGSKEPDFQPRAASKRTRSSRKATRAGSAPARTSRAMRALVIGGPP